MIVVDTSAWVEFLNDTGHEIVNDLECALENELICLGDLIYCEVLQGVKSKRELNKVKNLFGTLQKDIIGGFDICERASENYKYLRSLGVTVRKTIDIIIGTFCVENGHEIIHNDRDFQSMEEHLGLKSFRAP
ncbi:MAG: PIN domain-containing protein [Planctomycetes bacterium]|nr:PIN domain-containing protein [Planctomycetota bacterium]